MPCVSSYDSMLEEGRTTQPPAPGGSAAVTEVYLATWVECISAQKKDTLRLPIGIINLLFPGRYVHQSLWP